MIVLVLKAAPALKKPGSRGQACGEGGGNKPEPELPDPWECEEPADHDAAFRRSRAALTRCQSA